MMASPSDSLNSSTVSPQVDKKVKEKFFPCTMSFLDYIREKLKPALRLFAIQIQALYPFECKNGRDFKLDPKFLAQKLGYQSERTPQRFIAKLIKEGILERVAGKYQQLYRWVKKIIPVSGEQKPPKSKPPTPKPPKPPKSPVPTPAAEEVIESSSVEVTPVTDPYFGTQPTRNQWGQKDHQPNPDKLVPDGPWKNEHGRIHPQFLDWSAKRWIKARPDQYPNGVGKESMSLARMQVRGFYSVKPKETEALTQLDYDKKVTNLQNYWEEYSVEFNELKENYETRQTGIKGEELQRFSEMAQALQPELIQVEEPAPEPKKIPAREEQEDQGAFLDYTKGNQDEPQKKPKNFIAQIKSLTPNREKEKKGAEAIAKNRERLLSMEKDDPFLEHARAIAKKYGLIEVFDKNRRLIGFAESPESLGF